jgi:tetratricopeptide (TPR) repeat protein
MKKVALVLLLLPLFVGLAAAQQATLSKAETAHYQVLSQNGSDDATAIANELEAYFTLFNSYFHFDPSTLSSKLKVQVYSTQTDFNNFLSGVIPGTRDTFVYLQYSDPARSVLVTYHKPDPEDFQTDLVHHSFVQFLRSFVPQPPLWLQEGFAVYFEDSTYDASKDVAVFHPNLGWVPALQQGVADATASSTSGADNIIDPSDLLTIDASDANKNIQAFYAESWGLVSFLLNSDNRQYNRVLWDAVDALSPTATSDQNAAAIQHAALAWVNETDLEKGFEDYITSLQTFPELVDSGMKSYSSGDLKSAESDFTQAITIDNSNYIPYYYLGLINYSRKDFYVAEQYFQTSLQMGGNAGLVDYALGITAYADNRIPDAKKYLNQAVAVPASDYKDKANSLLDRINAQTQTSAQ